ncbi:MAG: type II toxin-antitoxin system VapC family toxin, partial [Candidatus Omnitrophica bacterium]|nr:type II toxin-antitoxin system VapC family toxin [Candidatus Omnitrophota bacterium]
MKPTVYLETTIPSFLTARPSNNLILAGEQELTRQWWEDRRKSFTLFVSELVIEEAQKGDSEASEKRMNTISDVSVLEIDEETIRLTEEIMKSGVIPERASADAGHIAVASRHGIDYLLTWNCRHIANAEIIRRLVSVVKEAGYNLPIICTPAELFGGQEDE